MSLFKFTKASNLCKSIQVNNFGNHAIDFTFIDYIVAGIEKVLASPPKEDLNENISPSSSSCPWRILNIGRGQQVQLMDFIGIIEKYYGIDAIGMISSHLVSELLQKKLYDTSRPKLIKRRSKSSPLRNQILFDCKEPDSKRMRLG